MKPGLQPSQGRLLIVEDDDPTRFALAKILTIKGYEVVTAATVQAALVKCEDHDCLLLDLHLPDGLGLEVLKRMRQKCRNARIAICSAAYDPALRDRVEEYQPDAVFIKPIDLDALLAWVARVCSKEQEAAPHQQAGGDSASSSPNA